MSYRTYAISELVCASCGRSQRVKTETHSGDVDRCESCGGLDWRAWPKLAEAVITARALPAPAGVGLPPTLRALADAIWDARHLSDDEFAADEHEFLTEFGYDD